MYIVFKSQIMFTLLNYFVHISCASNIFNLKTSDLSLVLSKNIRNRVVKKR